MSWLIEKREPVKKEKDNLLYHVTRYVYDKVGNKTEEKRSIDYVTQSEVPKRYHTIYFTYDRCNRLVRVTDTLGAAMEYSYDSLGNKTLERARINEDTYKTTRYEYNKVGLLEKMIQVVDKNDLGFESNQITNKSFLITTYHYDGNGNLTQIVTPEGYRISREYDLLDQMILEKVEDRAAGICRIRQYTYDKAGNRIKETNGLKQSISYTYDFANQLTHQVDEEGAVTRIFYDKNGRVN